MPAIEGRGLLMPLGPGLLRHINCPCWTTGEFIWVEHCPSHPVKNPLTLPFAQQPAPIQNDNPAIWDLVIRDMQARDSFGEAKYHTRLQAFNGRDSLLDAYQEVLDLAVYLKQWQVERAVAISILEDDVLPASHLPESLEKKIKEVLAILKGTK